MIGHRSIPRKIILSEWLQLPALLKIFSIVGILSATGALYIFGFFKEMELGGEAILDSVLFVQGLLLVSVYSGFIYVSVRFFAAINASMLKGLNVKKFLGLGKVINELVRESYPFITRWERAKLFCLKWIAILFIVAALPFVMTLLGWVISVNVGPFIDRSAFVTLVIKCLGCYIFVVFMLALSSTVDRGFFCLKRRFILLFSLPKLWLVHRFGVLGVCLLFATFVSGVGEARYLTLIKRPSVCVIVDGKYLSGKLVTRNSAGYIFASVVFPGRNVRDTVSAMAVVPFQHVDFLSSGLKCSGPETVDP